MATKIKSNANPQREGMFQAFKQLGDDYKKGSRAIAEMFQLCVVHATDKLIQEQDAPAILKAFLDGAGEMKESTQKKLKSNLIVLIRAGLLKDVKFADAIKRTMTMHAEKVKTKNKPWQLSEVYLSLARDQLKHEKRAISDAEIKKALEPPPSKKPNKAPQVTRMVKQVKNLSVAEAKQLLAALQDRLGIEGGAVVEEAKEADKGLNNMIQMAAPTGGKLLEGQAIATPLRAAGDTLKMAAQIAALLVKKPNKAKRK
jgi:hypothetical protein